MIVDSGLRFRSWQGVILQWKRFMTVGVYTRPPNDDLGCQIGQAQTELGLRDKRFERIAKRDNDCTKTPEGQSYGSHTMINLGNHSLYLIIKNTWDYFYSEG
jgi:hypothetical protein